MNIHERYHRDAEFRQLVFMLEHMIEKCQFTPTELREAAILAAIHFDQRRPLFFMSATETELLKEKIEQERMNDGEKVFIRQAAQGVTTETKPCA